MQDERLKNKNFIDSWKKAFSGIWYSIKTQRNLKVQLVIALVVIICAIYFKLDIIECMFLSFATMLVIITEVMNTAVEEAVNLTTDKFHPTAKIAKDVAAGAVVLASLNAVIIAIFIVIKNIF
ncbi:MAG: diacylglycerol kinase family protein [Clostridiaceae bacterium]|nr:diacylglycerol kinase family protein [Clostridiaceae bacterium]